MSESRSIVRVVPPESHALDRLPALPPAPPSYERLDDSDVFVAPRPQAARLGADPTVTLFVYGWHSVEPGPLSWVFPSLRAALDAVQKMRNAVAWCVVSGDTWTDLDEARESGAILVEQQS